MKRSAAHLAVIEAAEAARARARITIGGQRDHERAVDYGLRVLRCVRAVNGGDEGLEVALAEAAEARPRRRLIVTAEPRRSPGPEQPLPETALGRLLRSISGWYEDAERLGALHGALGEEPYERERFRRCGAGAWPAYQRGYETGRRARVARNLS